MLVSSLQIVFKRELEKLKKEIEAYRQEDKLWVIDGHIANTAGNLCLHLIGNLNHFIGAQLGISGYIRNRELEFSLKNIPRTELLQKIDETILIVDQTLGNLTPAQAEADYPLVVLSDKTTTGFFLIHLVSHLSYHIGQINYHRRLLDKA